MHTCMYFFSTNQKKSSRQYHQKSSECILSQRQDQPSFKLSKSHIQCSVHKLTGSQEQERNSVEKQVNQYTYDNYEMLTINSASQQLICRFNTLQSFLFTEEPTIHALQIPQVFLLKIKLKKICCKNLESLRQTATQY